MQLEAVTAMRPDSPLLCRAAVNILKEHSGTIIFFKVLCTRNTTSRPKKDDAYLSTRVWISNRLDIEYRCISCHIYMVRRRIRQNQDIEVRCCACPTKSLSSITERTRRVTHYEEGAKVPPNEWKHKAAIIRLERKI